MKGYTYSDLWMSIIRPPRDPYQESDLGAKKMISRFYSYLRNDFDLINQRNQILKCSHYEPPNTFRENNKLPCVIYLHGNSSSRLEAINYVQMILGNGMTLFTFDMSGSGMSEGEYVSLGYFEKYDLKTVLDYLRSTGSVSSFALWGRSMGAATVLMYADTDPDISCLILDSAFTDFESLATELYNKYSPLPSCVLKIGMSLVKKTVMSKAGFEIDELRPIDHVKKEKMPALFITAKYDDFVLPRHSEDLYKEYGGSKHLLTTDGDHNSERNVNVNEAIISFLGKHMNLDYMQAPSISDVKIKISDDDAKFDSMIKVSAKKILEMQKDK